MKILITGAKSGIGYHTGIILADMGHTVYFGTRTEKQKEALKEKLSTLTFKGIAKAIKLDINKKEDRKKIIKYDLDVLINNAAISVGGTILDLEISKIRDNFETNYFSTLKLTKLFINDLNKKDKDGSVIIVSSLAGIMPVPYLGSYASTKAALSMTATVLHQELLISHSKVKLKLVEPGLYHTGFNQFMLQNSKDNLKEENEYLSKYIDYESAIIRFLEINKTESIAKKIAKAAISKNYKLKYRAPLSQVLFTKLYMLLLK